MNIVKSICPCCQAAGQTIILDQDLDGGMISCTECGKTMHISGQFAKGTPETIAQTINELATCVAPYYVGGEN